MFWWGLHSHLRYFSYFWFTVLCYQEQEADEEVENEPDERFDFLFLNSIWRHLILILLHTFVFFWDRTRTKKKLIFPGNPPAKKSKRKNKGLSKSESAPKDGKTPEQSTPSEHHDVPDDVEAEKIVRKSTRTSVVIRQAERDAIRAALQATMKVSWNDDQWLCFTRKRNIFWHMWLNLSARTIRSPLVVFSEGDFKVTYFTSIWLGKSPWNLIIKHLQ